MGQEKEIKFFGNPASGHLDADGADFSLPPDSWTNAENVRTGTTDAGVINTVESVGSTTLLSAPSPSVTFYQIGAEPDDPNNRIIYFLYNTYGSDHKIVSYDTIANVFYNVLLSSQVTGGLNFNKDYPIHSVRIVNGMLYWVEGTNNQPRKINIDSGIRLNHPGYASTAQPYVSPLAFDEITLIKPPPQLAPNIQKANDAAFVNNFIANDSFEFAFGYIYYDNEETIVGTYSPASRLNVPSDNYNYIAVQMDGGQRIPNTVKIVTLAVRIGNTNNAKTIKTWDKSVASELTQIQNQNNSVAQLTFNFYNNITGQTIPTDYVLKPFDNVPTYAWALESARNRLFLANVVSGYDTPTTTSLQVTQNITGISGVTSIIKPVVQVRVKVGVPGPDNDFVYAAWYVYLSSTDISVPGYYLINGTEQTALNQPNLESNPVLPAPPASTSLAGLTFKGATQRAVTDAAAAPIPPNTNEAGAFYSSSYTITISGISSAVDAVMKSRSSYKAGMVFYDFAMRKCGVVTNDGLIINIASRNYDFTVATRSLTWSVSNTNRLAEIPIWAYYYTPVRTLNLRTRNFVVSFDNTAKYATKDAAGAYVFSNDTFLATAVGIGLNTTALVQSGLGYVYTAGDVAILVDDTNNIYELPVIGQSGNYIVVSAKDIGSLLNKKIIYDIYTPYQTSDQEPFFEVGQMYKVNNPGTANREYSITSDVFVADSYTITRNFNTVSYAAEAMSPNDLFYKTWYNDGGKPNFIVKLGETAKQNFIYWSNTYIPGTSVNGLSAFEAVNQTDVPQECGAIQKIILTAKVNSEGTVMLGICSKETVSIYLGETQIADSTGQTQFFAASSGVIGTINDLKKSYGTMNPEGVTEFRGKVFWPDVANGKIIQYSENGLFAISDYNMTRFWKLFSDLYMITSAATIENLGGRPFIFMTVDPHHMELLISIPKLSTTPPKGYLPDYPETIYPFDIWDAKGKCLGKDTKVIMADFTLKNVEDINVGDMLLSPDGSSKTVLSLARGREQMYWVRQRKGIDYRVNESHILSLKVPKYKDGYSHVTDRFERENVPVKKYLSKSNHWKRHVMGHRSELMDFENKEVKIDPYFLGVWLGDGNKRNLGITSIDYEIIDYISAFANKNGGEVRSANTTYYIKGAKGILKDFVSYGLINDERYNRAGFKHIPIDYIRNSVANRLELLAGIIDTDGSLIKEKVAFEITQKNKRLSDDIASLARGLGFYVKVTPKIASMKRTDGSVYKCQVYRIYIGGNVHIIPVKIKRKKAAIRNQDKNVLHTGIKVEKDIVDDYYGFTIDGDGLFLLEDFTVTHNTMVYKLENGSQPPHWQGAYSFNPEGFATLDNDLYGFKNGQLYKHNSQTSFNNFYGVQYRSKIMFVSNMQPKTPKAYDAISIEANMVPLLTYVYADSPHQQSSDLVDNDYRNFEGVYYATFFRNKLIPTATGYATNGLLTGEKIRTAALKIMLEFLVTNTPVELKFVNILFSTSLGHKTT